MHWCIEIIVFILRGMPIQLNYVSGQAGDPQSRWNVWQNTEVDQLGKSAARYQKSVLASALEVIHITEIDIPELQQYSDGDGSLSAGTTGICVDERGGFIVRLYHKTKEKTEAIHTEEAMDLILFCRTPRTRKEICEYLGLSSV